MNGTWPDQRTMLDDRDAQTMRLEADMMAFDRFAEPEPTSPGTIVTCPVCGRAEVEVWASQYFIHRMDAGCRCGASSMVDREAYRRALVRECRRVEAERIAEAAATMSMEGVTV